MAALVRLPLRAAAFFRVTSCSDPSNTAAVCPRAAPKPIRRNMMTKREFYINGRWTPPVAARDLPVIRPPPPSFQTLFQFCSQTHSHALFRQVINPSTEDVFAVISLGSHADADAAVAAAKCALPAWSHLPPAQRRAYVQAILHQYFTRCFSTPLPMPTPKL